MVIIEVVEAATASSNYKLQWLSDICWLVKQVSIENLLTFHL